MSDVVEIRLPVFPECWSSCGNCGSQGVIVDDILVKEGDHILRDDTMLVLETGKVALDIPCPVSGEVLAVLVEIGTAVVEREVVLLVLLDN